ncbi:Ferrichrome ABC transporter permease [Planctomycetales bacterium 10988]|nr:Ferrichrome ABC transporter permease [Planctomycetales bacterium 10988]
MLKYSLFAGTIFLSAFLLFLVQPMMGSYVLPWFGGTPVVWNTCLLFFQSLLLAGYAYAHWSSQRLGLRQHLCLHGGIACLSVVGLLFFPPSVGWKPNTVDFPVFQLLGLLTISLGVPYFLLSTTGPLLQEWFRHSVPKRDPYWLYALSNTGSLIALLGYPFGVEILWGREDQTLLWKGLFLLFIVLNLGCLLIRWRVGTEGPSPEEAEKETQPVSIFAKKEPPAIPPTRSDDLFWTSLAFGGSLLLLASTNQICQDVAAVPFLWVLPLALYLLTFILCFSTVSWYSRGPYLAILAAILLQTLSLMSNGFGTGLDFEITVQIATYSAMLFVGCMCLHGELSLAKPAPQHLTRFYLNLSLGGALGGMFVTLVAPFLFQGGYWEYPLSLGMVYFLLGWALFRNNWKAAWEKRSLKLAGFLGLGWSLAIMLILLSAAELKETTQAARNSYGVIRIEEEEVTIENDEEMLGHEEIVFRSLLHGRILHGGQYQREPWKNSPSTYYTPKSGIGVAFRGYPPRQEGKPIKIGVIGLGTGSLAVWGEQGDEMKFYEINPLVADWAKTFFTYLQDTPADTEIVLGDARLSLEQQLDKESENFDILVLDAFSGDAIPIHLLTLECFQVYWKHLKEDGILAIHISNKYLDLEPVIRGLTYRFSEIRQHPYKATLITYDPDHDENAPPGSYNSYWMLVTKNADFLVWEANREMENPSYLDMANLLGTSLSDEASDQNPGIVWTDDYVNLFEVVR